MSRGRFRDVQRYFASRSSSSVTYAAISAFSVRVKSGRGRNGEERRVEREERENERVVLSKIRATWQRRGPAPYRACARVPELAARVSKLAFSLSRLQVSDYFGNVGARRPAHSAAAFLRVPLFHARFDQARAFLYIHAPFAAPHAFFPWCSPCTPSPLPLARSFRLLLPRDL